LHAFRYSSTRLGLHDVFTGVASVFVVGALATADEIPRAGPQLEHRQVANLLLGLGSDVGHRHEPEASSLYDMYVNLLV
jgi:hypothetical protein